MKCPPKIGGHQIMDDAPKLQVWLVGRDGRRRYNPTPRDQLVAACSEPDVSVSGLAREHGVNANLVRKWIKNAKEERRLPLVPAFVPVQIAPDMPLVSGCYLLPKREPLGKPGPASKVSALLPNEVSLILDGIDIDAMIRHPVRQYQITG
ncbi:IS66-like element accessory protein TnpA [Rhizobium sp. A37_96]